MEIAIIKYNAGNIRSVLYALDRIGVHARVTDDPDEIRGADKVIFPGVGEASSAMQYLTARGLDKVIIGLKQPVLGICLGMQLLCSHSEENDTECLKIFPTTVKKFSLPTAAGKTTGEGLSGSPVLKVPQIGWNNIFNLRSSLLEGIKENDFMYFVHSYYAVLSEDTIATAEYILPYSAALHKDNFYGVQFHTEKSADAGGKILSNFILNVKC